MPLYVIHRIERTLLPPNHPISPSGVEIKFFPIRNPRGHPDEGELYLLDAHSPDSAFSLAKHKFPLLATSLAIQPLEAFQNDLAKFSALRESPRGFSPRAFRPAETRSPVH